MILHCVYLQELALRTLQRSKCLATDMNVISRIDTYFWRWKSTNSDDFYLFNDVFIGWKSLSVDKSIH
jgi:hypothetical protein